MHFDENDVVTSVHLDVDADTIFEALDRSCSIAEMLECSTLRVESRGLEEDGPNYSSVVTSVTSRDSSSSIGDSFLAAAYPALEKFRFSEDRYRTIGDEGDDEDEVFADLVAPPRFFPKMGVTVSSISGFTASYARADYPEAEYPFRRRETYDSGRVHSVFPDVGNQPDEIVVRPQLWLAAADLTTAAGLIRQPLRELDGKALELLPAGARAEDGYHAALLGTVASDASTTREERMLAAVRDTARFFGIPEDSATVEQWPRESIGVVRNPQVLGNSTGARWLEGIYVRLGADPLGIVDNNTSRFEPDEDLEEDDLPEGDFTDEQLSEFVEVFSGLQDVLGQVWLVVTAEVRCSHTAVAEDALRNLLEDIRPRVSAEKTWLIPEETCTSGAGKYRAQASMHTFERDHRRVLDGLMNTLDDGMWRSSTRPWGTDENEETVIRWNPFGATAEGEITELTVRAVYGPPKWLWEQCFEEL
ncbi:hypothetical protein SAMN04487820_104267 [Actinopolyspora mzabensis]|uniref:Uncharacterized protein n=1 Tax=Actinopolyspora mzabensis TaxID=995066 RepID=A0A1G8Z6L3_ACTMZ|nr:hypothetical protein [Actinopolyspora mzabensis]SDK10706.1 hypothetical protein SAMN04487820_104267 [Actinopolyspora mzabensis]